MTQTKALTFSANTLMAKEFPPTKYVVPGLIPEGMSILVAAPKVGKSWLVLGLANGLSTGTPLLGGIDIDHPRPVLYLALEDGEKRLQARLNYMGVAGSELLEFCINLNGQSVVQLIHDWMHDHAGQDPVVFLDTLGKVMPAAQGNSTQYSHEYAVGSALKATCDAVAGSSLVIVHHTRKQDSSDFVDSVSGTNGIAGSADSILVLRRERLTNTATLEITSRDAAEGSFELVFQENGVWELAGRSLDAAQEAASQARVTKGLGEHMIDVITAVTEHPEGVTPSALKSVLSHVPNVDLYLKRAVDAGRILKLTRGLYAPVISERSVSFTSPAGSKLTELTQLTPPAKGLCNVCAETLHPVLVADGISVHPTCEGDA